MQPMRARDTIAIFAIPVLFLGAMALAEAYVPAGSYVPWATTLLGPLLGLVCGALLVLLLRLLLRNSCSLIICGMMIVLYSMAMGGPSLLRYLNMALDRSGTAYTLTVLESRERPKGTDTIVLQHWIAGEDPFTADGSYPKGAALEIIVHEGNLGLVWIETPLNVAHNELKRGKR